MTSCGRTEEVAGDWWAGFVAGNGRVLLEERTTHWVPVECISGFSSHTPSLCTKLTWVVGCTFLILPFDVVSGPFGDNVHAN